MPHWSPLATDEDDEEPSRFIIDNDVDVWVRDQLQGKGLSAVSLPENLRDAADHVVLAEAKRMDRVLITHDQRFVDPRNISPDENPGIVIIPRDGQGRLDWGLISAVLAHIYLSRHGVDQTVVYVYSSGRITIWNPNEYTGKMEPVFCRLNRERDVEVWVDDDEEWASEPDYDL
jgi:hypothetical protein